MRFGERSTSHRLLFSQFGDCWRHSPLVQEGETSSSSSRRGSDLHVCVRVRASLCAGYERHCRRAVAAGSRSCECECVCC
jgi:hypothetical protein